VSPSSWPTHLSPLEFRCPSYLRIACLAAGVKDLSKLQPSCHPRSYLMQHVTCVQYIHNTKPLPPPGLRRNDITASTRTLMAHIGNRWFRQGGSECCLVGEPETKRTFDQPNNSHVLVRIRPKLVNLENSNNLLSENLAVVLRELRRTQTNTSDHSYHSIFNIERSRWDGFNLDLE
jgi:hypothetical protein